MELAATRAVGRAELSLVTTLSRRTPRHLIQMMLALFAALLLCSNDASAQTTGQLRVVLVEDSADELTIPNIAVQLSGETLIGGVQERTSDGNGEVLFTGLPPGLYTLVVPRAAGFSGVTIEKIQINLNRLTQQVIKLQTKDVEDIVIVAKAKAVDTTSSSTGRALDKSFLNRIPAGRSYSTAVQTVPGVTGGAGGNPNMGGASSNENTYALDGSNMTPPNRAASSVTIPNTESYAHPGHGPLVMSEQDRLSTFAIDVDTASYALARAKLNAGVLPVPDAVRVEEFVNAFRYRWTPPTNTDPIAIRMEAAQHPIRSDRILLSVALQGAEVTEERPVHLTFLVDVSGSMSSPDKLGLAQQAMHKLVNGLGREDRVAIATYAGRTGIALQPTFTVNKAPIHAAIDGLSSGGSTAMGAGIELAYGMASEMYLEGAENRVVILTDGDANVGQSSPEGLLSLVKRWAGDGITLSVVGFGQGNYKDALLEMMADKGDGNYHYVDSTAEADRVFGRDLSRNLVTLARDVKVQIEFPTDSVLAWRQIGYENRAVADEDFRNDRVDGGEVGSGHQVTALYELVLRDNPKGDLAKVSVRAKPPGKESGSIEFGTTLSASKDIANFSDATRDLRFAAGVATFAELLRRSPHVAEVSFGQTLRILEGAADPSNPDHRELLGLVKRAADLSGGLQATVTPDPVLPQPTQRASR